MKNDFKISCCFCGKDSDFNEAIEITIALDQSTEEVQAVYAHPKCVDKVLHKSIPRGFNKE